MADWLLPLIEKHRSTGLLLDTQLLVLLLIGRARPRLIGSGRTGEFTTDDYRRLDELTRRFRRIICTPHVLTETSNLLRQDLRRSLDFGAAFDVKDLEERGVSAVSVTGDPTLAELGLTDAVLNRLALDGCLLMTVDFKLYARLRKTADVVNFNHLR